MKNLFENIINLYNFARPGYPKELFKDIIAYSGIDLPSKILEVGAGTGQATTFFAEHGFKITALEVGEQQVLYLKEKYEKYPNVCIEKSKFEDFESKTKFELIIAASSFHWIDKKIRYKKACSLMSSRGTLAQFWHMHPVQRFEGGIFVEINEIYDKYFNKKDFCGDIELNRLIEKRTEQLVGNNFKNVSFYKYKYDSLYSAYEYAALLATYSYVQALGIQKRNFLIEIYKRIKASGGMIHIPTEVHMFLAKKN